MHPAMKSFAALLLSVALPASGEKLMRCSETQRVEYSEGDFFNLRDHVSLGKNARIAAPKHGDTGWVWSPQETSAYRIARRPDYSRDGERNSVIEIAGTSSHPLSLQLMVYDHGNTDVQLRWLSDHWLSVHSWVGRMVDSNVIIDVDAARIVLADQGSYHLMSEPCE